MFVKSIKDSHSANPPLAYSKLGIKEITDQVRHDLVGKDVQDTPTYSYVWMADQLGHIALGWFSAVLVFWLVKMVVSVRWIHRVLHVKTGHRIALVLALAVPLLLWGFLEISYRRKALSQAKGYFPIDDDDLKKNVKVALAYFYVGIFWGHSTLRLDKPVRGILTFFAAAAASVKMSLWWLRQKMTIQQADLPGLYRMGEFDEHDLTEHTKQADDTVIDRATVKARIIDFFDEPCTPWKLVVVGGTDRNAKTRLVTGLGSELAFNKYIVSHNSFGKFVDLLSTGQTNQGFRNLPRWPWKESQVLMLDGINFLRDPLGQTRIDYMTIAQKLHPKNIPHLADSQKAMVIVLPEMDPFHTEVLFKELVMHWAKETEGNVNTANSLLVLTQ